MSCTIGTNRTAIELLPEAFWLRFSSSFLPPRRRRAGDIGATMTTSAFQFPVGVWVSRTKAVSTSHASLDARSASSPWARPRGRIPSIPSPTNKITPSGSPAHLDTTPGGATNQGKIARFPFVDGYRKGVIGEVSRRHRTDGRITAREMADPGKSGSPADSGSSGGSVSGGSGKGIGVGAPWLARGLKALVRGGRGGEKGTQLPSLGAVMDAVGAREAQDEVIAAEGRSMMQGVMSAELPTHPQVCGRLVVGWLVTLVCQNDGSKGGTRGIDKGK